MQGNEGGEGEKGRERMRGKSEGKEEKEIEVRGGKGERRRKGTETRGERVREG